MPNYWRLRTKYHCFLDWIRLVKNHKLYRTTSVKKMLLKRKHRAFASTRLLKERGARRCLCGNQNLWRVLPRPRRHLVDFHTGRCRSIHQDKWADVRATFSRWSTYAFDQIRWRQMTVLGTKRVRLKLLQKMFSVLKSEAGFGVIAGRTPWVRRIDADLGVCSLYFVAPRRKTDLLNNLRKSNAVHRKAVADGARNGPTFKKFMDSVGGAAMARLYSEQSMLLKAFELKGDLRYKDVDVDIQSPPDADTEAAEFKDTVCPPGVRVCAVRVIAKRNWGVLGVGTELEGDGDKIDRPFRGGNNGGKFTKETFALGEFEHLTGIEIHCSQSVVEAIRFEASTLGNVRKDRKDGMAGAEMFERKRWCGVSKTKTRWSKLYGEVSSLAPRIYTIRGPDEAAIVSLRGLATSSRIIGLGAVCRVVAEEGVFSTAWTRPLRAPVKSSGLLPSVTVNKESTKRRWQKMRSTKRLLGGGLVAKGSRDQVDVFAAIIKMRKTDATEGIKRCEAFARRVWTSNIFRADPNLRPLLNINIMMQMARWLFNAIAAPLPPIPNKDDKFNVRFERAEAKLANCIQQQENALWQERKVGKRRDDHTKALAIAAATPREKQNPQQRMMLANRAMNSPMWRARESRRNLRDDADLAKAASDHAIATKERASAQMMVDICHDKIIWLDPRAPRVRKKFRRLIALARRQIQLQGDHEGGAVKFLEDIKETCELPPTAGGPLPTRVFERALDGLHVKKQKALRETARAARRAEYERQLILAARTADAPEPAPYVDDYETEESESLDGWG